MVVANGAAHPVAGETEIVAAAPTPVLVLPIGHSAFQRLCMAAVREGVDVNTLALALVMYGLGQGVTRLVASPSATRNRPDDVGTTEVAVVCLSCGRPRQDEHEPRCTTCRGSWTLAVR